MPERVLVRATLSRPHQRTVNWRPWLFVAPAGLIVVAVTILPLFYGLYLSLTNWNLMTSLSPHFSGLAAYRSIFSSSQFYSSLRLTVYWAIGTLFLEIIVALPLAMLLNVRTPITGAITGLMMLPWITPFVVLAYAWVFLYDGTFGPLHALLHGLHLVGGVSPLAASNEALWAVILISGWQGMPFLTVALLAARKGIPQELYEAAAVDGAARIRMFRRITLPLLTPTLGAMSVILFVQAFYSFDIVWLSTKGGPGSATNILGVNLYQTFFSQAQPGAAAALGTLMLIILVFAMTPLLVGTSRRGRT